MPEDTHDRGDQVHIIVSGETLSKIAARYHIDLGQLLKANPQIKDPNKIMVGQRLRVPNAIAPAPVMTTPVVAAPSVPAPAPADGAPPRAGMPDTSGLDAAGKYDLYSQFFMRYGVNLAALDPGARALLGLRVTTSTKARGGAGVYDDRVVVVWREAGGAKRVEEFEANTEPSARYEGRLGSDANRDGRKDLGCLPEGLYEFQKGTSAKYGNVLRPVRDIFVVRDTDHDGDFDDDDKAASVRALLNSGGSLLFHKGGNNITGSAGCQTFRPAVFNGFWKALGPQRRFQYVLCTVA